MVVVAELVFPVSVVSAMDPVDFVAGGLLFLGFASTVLRFLVCAFGFEEADFSFVLWITKRSLVWRRTFN